MHSISNVAKLDGTWFRYFFCLCFELQINYITEDQRFFRKMVKSTDFQAKASLNYLMNGVCIFVEHYICPIVEVIHHWSQIKEA